MAYSEQHLSDGRYRIAPQPIGHTRKVIAAVLVALAAYCAVAATYVGFFIDLPELDLFFVLCMAALGVAFYFTGRGLWTSETLGGPTISFGRWPLPLGAAVRIDVEPQIGVGHIKRLRLALRCEEEMMFGSSGTHTASSVTFECDYVLIDESQGKKLLHTEVELPVHAMPSTDAAAYSSRWTLLTEIETDDQSHRDDEFPILVGPSMEGDAEPMISALGPTNPSWPAPDAAGEPTIEVDPGPFDEEHRDVFPLGAKIRGTLKSPRALAPEARLVFGVYVNDMRDPVVDPVEAPAELPAGGERSFEFELPETGPVSHTVELTEGFEQDDAPAETMALCWGIALLERAGDPTETLVIPIRAVPRITSG